MFGLWLWVDEVKKAENDDSDPSDENEVVEIGSEVFFDPEGMVEIHEDTAPDGGEESEQASFDVTHGVTSLACMASISI